MLLAVLVDAEAFKIDVAAGAELRLDGTRDVDRTLHGQMCHTAFHNGELDGDDTSHFDGAAERDFAIALGEVQIADAELGPFDEYREVDFAAATEVFDIAVAWHRTLVSLYPREYW